MFSSLKRPGKKGNGPVALSRNIKVKKKSEVNTHVWTRKGKGQKNWPKPSCHGGKERETKKQKNQEVKKKNTSLGENHGGRVGGMAKNQVPDPEKKVKGKGCQHLYEAVKRCKGNLEKKENTGRKRTSNPKGEEK